MAQKFLYIPNRAIDSEGISTGTTFYFYLTGTSVLADIFEDADLTVPAENPMSVDAGAIVPQVYYSEDDVLRVRIVYADGEVDDEDPWSPLSAADVNFIATGAGAVNRPIASKLEDIVSVLDYGAVADGVTDCAAAIRKAIDALPEGGGTVFFPAGEYYVGSTVICPIKDYGLELRGERAQIIGTGKTGITIFETGMTTTSVGGVTNWGQANETYVHRALIIRGFNFRACNVGIKAFNAIWGSRFEDNWFDDFTTAIHAKRCFYTKVLNNQARPNDAARLSTVPIYHFEEANNVMWIQGNSAGGIVGAVTRTGIGYSFTGGLSGLHFLNNSAEGCVTGFSNSGEITGALITGCFFEANTVAVDLGSAGKTGLIVEGNWFAFIATVAIGSGGGWVSGRLGPNHHKDGTTATNGGTIELGTATNSMDVWLPPQQETLVTSTTGMFDLPTGWTVSPSALVLRTIGVYDQATGQTAQRARNTMERGASGIIPFNFVGSADLSVNTVPFAFVQNNASGGAGTVLFDTQIASGTYVGVLLIDLTIVHSAGTSNLLRMVYGGTIVHNLDADPMTLTVSSSAGFIRLTTSALNTVTAITGKIRVI